jgi:hypothetical protein
MQSQRILWTANVEAGEGLHLLSWLHCLRMKKWKRTVRVCTAFTDAEWSIVVRAVNQRHRMRDPDDGVSRREVANFVHHSVLTICRAMLEQGYQFAPVACDLRFETPEETEERINLNERYAAGLPICEPRRHEVNTTAERAANVVDLGWLKGSISERQGA